MERLVFLKGEKVVLRPLQKETDLESCVVWLNDPDVTQYLLINPPVSKDQESEWFDNLKKRPNNVILGIEILKGGVFIGTIGLHNIVWKDRRATLGIFIGDKNYWGAGFGADAIKLIIGYAFNTLNLRKISLGVLDFNERGYKCYLKCGFKEEGRFIQHIYKNGRYADEIWMSIFD